MALSASNRVSSFPPVAAADARVLVLGSMPGVASLSAQRYYAHPRNAFWPLMGELLGFDPQLDYERRLAALRRAGVALWDVLGHCERPGSLDADIVRDSCVPNDFAGFFNTHPQVRAVFFNGNTAAQAFRRQVLPTLTANSLALHTLPSTSPAHAGLSFARKRAAWQALADALQRPAQG
ncbi:MAG TPA: DNA-deoxyinosine glycosylase [Fontimonas sp.]